MMKMKENLLWSYMSHWTKTGWDNLSIYPHSYHCPGDNEVDGVDCDSPGKRKEVLPQEGGLIHVDNVEKEHSSWNNILEYL